MIELLVVFVIIGILAAMLLPVISKARRAAVLAANQEGFRQKGLGRMADTANIANPKEPEGADRDTCRESFRNVLDTGSAEIFITELWYGVETEKEFRAYWHTLINPSATEPLEFAGGDLIATDERGNEFRLPPLGEGAWAASSMDEDFVVAWEFISTHWGETTVQGFGINVMYSNGSTQYIDFPGEFPATSTVAELSHRFVVESE